MRNLFLLGVVLLIGYQSCTYDSIEVEPENPVSCDTVGVQIICGDDTTIDNSLSTRDTIGDSIVVVNGVDTFQLVTQVSCFTIDSVEFCDTSIIAVKCTTINNQTQCDSLTPRAPVEEKITYTDDIAPIFTLYCNYSGCHPRGDANWNTYSDIVNGFYFNTAIADKDASKSFAFQRMENGSMPPSNSPGPKIISQEDLEKMREWIETGAPE